MGPGDEANPQLMRLAEELGRQIALAGWITLSGGALVSVADSPLAAIKLCEEFLREP